MGGFCWIIQIILIHRHFQRENALPSPGLYPF
nr:MAG TPA: hypothetical protein [Caudoviricetes sp.]